MRGLAIPRGAHSQSLARAVASPRVTQSQAAGQSQQQRCGAHSPAASSAIAKTPHRQARQPNLGDLPQRIRLCFGTPVNWRTRRGSANAWLKGTLTRGTPALYSAQPNRANNSHRKSNFTALREKPRRGRGFWAACWRRGSPTCSEMAARPSAKRMREGRLPFEMLLFLVCS